MDDPLEVIAMKAEGTFYTTGESREQLLKSPHLEAFKAKGYEALTEMECS